MNDNRKLSVDDAEPGKDQGFWTAACWLFVVIMALAVVDRVCTIAVDEIASLWSLGIRHLDLS